jgi:hypothetical protein
MLQIGAQLNASSLVTALHMKDSNTLHWIIKNGVNFNSKDMFGRELTYWIASLNRYDIITEFYSELELVKAYTDEFGLNPNELSKLKCVERQDGNEYFQRFELASELKTSVNLAKCSGT